jgi:hypothetical protein
MPDAFAGVVDAGHKAAVKANLFCARKAPEIPHIGNQS